MSNILVSIEAKQCLRNELVSTPEGRLYVAILNQALLDVIGNNDYATRKTALNWFQVKQNAMRDFCYLLAEVDGDYILRKIKQKVGTKKYEDLSGY